MTVHLSPLWPAWLIAVLATSLLAVTACGVLLLIRRHVRPRLVLALAGCRLAVWVVVVLVLLQPSVSYQREQQQRPDLLVLVDTSSRPGQPADQQRTRWHALRSILQEGNFATALRERFDSHWFVAGASPVPLHEQDLARLQPGQAQGTMAESLADLVTIVRAEGKRPARVLLVSGGADPGEVDPASAARQLGLMVDVLAPTGAGPAKETELQIADVQGTRRVLLGSETHFRIVLAGATAARPHERYQIQMFEDGKLLKTMPWTQQAGPLLTVAHRPTAAGLKRYSFSLSGADGKQVGPAKELAVDVTDGRYEILVLEDSWRWEYRFLHRLFEEDPGFRFTALLPRGRSSVQFASPDRRINLVGFPQGRAELEGFDLFFLGDVQPQRWPRGLSAALSRLVSQEGKSLVVIAGPGVGRLAEVPELNGLLPVDLPGDAGAPLAGPVEVQLPAGAEHSPFFFQVPAAQPALPPLDQIYPALRKRPGATVLLEASKYRNAYGKLIVMAEHTVGRGRVLFVGTDVLWKWQTLGGEGPTPYRTFWQQALRALTPGRTRATAAALWVTPGRSWATVGEPISLRAEADVQPAGRGRIEAWAQQSGGKRLALAFAPDAANPNVYHAELTPTVPGLCRVSAALFSAGKQVTEGSAAIPVEGLDAKGSDRGSTAGGALARLASATGGHLVDPARPETWPAPPDEPRPAVREQRTVDLWNNFTLLLVFSAALAADWFLRLFNALV